MIVGMQEQKMELQEVQLPMLEVTIPPEETEVSNALPLLIVVEIQNPMQKRLRTEDAQRQAQIIVALFQKDEILQQVKQPEVHPEIEK